MAEAEIAFVAAAGAAGLALAVSAWAWRLRQRLALREASVEAHEAERSAALSEREGALTAFDDIRIGLTSDGGVTSLLGSTAAVVAAREALCPDDDGADDAVVLASAVHAASASRGISQSSQGCCPVCPPVNPTRERGPLGAAVMSVSSPVSPTRERGPLGVAAGGSSRATQSLSAPR